MGFNKIIARLVQKRILNIAARHYQNNDFENAEKTYLLVLEREPNDFEGLLWLGTLYAKNGHYTKAFELLEKAISVKPSNVHSYFNLALLQAKLNRPEIAIEIFEKSLIQCKMTKRKKAEIFYNISRLHIDIKDYGKALDFANKALVIRSNYQEAKQIRMHAFDRLKK